MVKRRILYIKNSSSKVNLNTYNVQAVGLGKAFCRLGYDYDFLFFTNEDKVIQENTICGHQMRVLCKRGLRILRSYYCREVLDQDYLKQYDFVISTEYGQLMTYFLSKVSDNIVLYSGPYYNLFKLPFVSPIYDALFTKTINYNIKCKFVKSKLAKEYLENKGYTDLQNIGVALDIERFDAEVEMQSATQKLMEYMSQNRCILYVGALSDRKNFPFLLKVYQHVRRDNPDVKFVVIGKGKKQYVDRHMTKLTEEERSGIYRLEQIDNAQLKYIYPLAKAFLLPSKLEIFGMVLLESMYLGAPVVTSWNGGSSTLIDGQNTGMIVKEFDAAKWAEAVQTYLDDEERTLEITRNARNLIETEYVWDALAKKMLDKINLDQ